MTNHRHVSPFSMPFVPRAHSTTSYPMHKTNLLQISGAMLLLVCIAFAITRLASADAWVAYWIPCVGVGLTLCIIGTILPAMKRRSPHE